MKAGYPNTSIQLEDKIGMRLVRFCGANLSIIGSRREPGPRGFPQYAPCVEQLALQTDSGNHVETGVGDEQSPVMRGSHMVNIMKTGQGNVVRPMKSRNLEDQYFRLGADVQSVATERPALEDG